MSSAAEKDHKLGGFLKALVNPIASKRLLAIVWPFLVIVVVLLIVSAQSMEILLATRSYSEGESLWSKGQKRAIFYLLRYETIYGHLGMLL